MLPRRLSSANFTIPMACNFKTILSVAIIGAAGVFASYSIRGTHAAQPPMKGPDDFTCDRIERIAGDIDDQFSARGGRLELARMERTQRIQSGRSELDARREEGRVAMDKQRGELFRKLESQAASPEQRAAVAAFESAVIDAARGRRDAADRAISELRGGIDRAVVQRMSRIDTAEQSLRQQVRSSLTRAKANCGISLQPPEVRSELKESIGSVQSRFRGELDSAKGLEQSLPPLAESERAALESAELAMRRDLEQARSALLSAFRR
jgi:hypothetical protein